MPNRLLLVLLVLYSGLLQGQPRDELVGEWKSYGKDNSVFEFLQLNTNGTGLKCFGRTINGSDTLFTESITALYITNWEVKKNTLILHSQNEVSFNVNPNYKLQLKKNELTLEGEHLILSLFPSNLNRNMFQRTVAYQKANLLRNNNSKVSCISDDRSLFVFKPVDTTFQLASYKGTADLIPTIVSCYPAYEYVESYPDRPYSLLVPHGIRRWSFGFGDKMFYLRFDLNDTEKSDATIVIYYDFDNSMRNRFFSDLKEGKETKEILRKNGSDIYKTINWQQKFEGKIFLPNSMVIAYYTGDSKLEPMLQECIASLKYRDE